MPTEIAELENKADGQNETKADEEFVVNQIYGLFEFNRARGSIKQFSKQTTEGENFDQSQHSKNVRERNPNTHLFKPSPPLNSANTVNQILSNPKNKMDKVTGIDMEFIYKKRGHSPETKRFSVERNNILKPDKTRIVGKGKQRQRTHTRIQAEPIRQKADSRTQH